MAKPGTLAAQSEQPEIVIVPETMSRSALLRHCRTRHATLRFVTPENHAADHRLRPDVQEHLHEDPDPEGETLDSEDEMQDHLAEDEIISEDPPEEDPTVTPTEPRAKPSRRR